MTDGDRMRLAVRYIEEHLGEPLRVRDAARVACMSEYHFARSFSILCGQPVIEYVRARRLTRALAALRTTDASVLDIALDCGYDSPEGFSRAFQRQFGVSPTAARKAARADDLQSLGVPELFPHQGNIKEVHPMDDMTRYAARGYYVKENAPVYFCKDMDATLDWFKNILGWYGGIDARDKQGRATYGCVFDYPGELIVANLTPFRGIHLFSGEPSRGVVAFIYVVGLEKLRDMILENGWTQVTAIEPQPWGAMECSVTTLDGSIIRFFETT